ncbi:hypothetical protein DVK44_08425 [Streptomyces paludis]|uniref:DNA-binding protein n=2 Tax=Streptomyces paludis TaxID=2282738 RepID=A0A345HLZ3_9ACTN|nr:hypothetical protein DVK44_08425 [Streptomyces paludis]
MDPSALLDAGAVLPIGTGNGPGDGPGSGSGSGAEAAGAGDVLTARTYGHPALDGRAVVRLVPEAIGAAEDLSLEYLGFGPASAAGVGRVKRQSLGFPAWALVHDPAHGHHALAVVKEMERLARLVATKPGLAKEGFDEIGERLDRSVPHFLPTYYEQVARLFLAADSRQQASVFFGKARAAEQRHALEVDEDRLREVFLEFAGAGALSGKALREHAKGLAVRLSAAEAYGQFKAVSLERCAAGLAPYAGMLEDLRRLAKGAGLDAGAEERSLLAEIIHTGPMNRAAGSFWKSALPALTVLAAEDRSVRERLLGLLPATGGDSPAEFDASWLDLLARCGAFELLRDGTVPAAGWLSGWAAHRQRGWRDGKRMPAELAVVEKLVDRLVAEGTPVRLLTGRGWRLKVDLDLLDACLAWGVPVAGPAPEDRHLDLTAWLTDTREGARDLAALAADPRFARVLRAGVEQAADTGDSTVHLAAIVRTPALRGVLADWFGERADDLSRPLGLPELDGLLTRLSHFSAPSVLATAPEPVARITAVSPAPALARTLRAGILDELGWPALEQALPNLGAVNPRTSGRRGGRGEWYQVADAWPALLLRVGTRVAAVGPESVLDERVLTLPAKDTHSWDTPVFGLVDGQWLISNGFGDDRRAVWSGRPADAFPPSGTLPGNGGSTPWPSLALPGGGRCYGGRPVHAGDTSFAAERRPVASDGVSLWVLHENEWWEYDPESARRGRVSVPAFFDSALGSGVTGEGVRLVRQACRLLPVQPGLEGSPFGSANGLLGWWVVYDPKERTFTACSVDGSRSPAVPLPDGSRAESFAQGLPVPPLRLPGGAALYPRESRGHHGTVSLYDADGVLLASVGSGGGEDVYAAGTPFVPPLDHWHALRARDERGSAALRAVTDADAAALLAAVVGGTKAPDAVRRLLPGIGHPGLIAGVAGLLDEAARHSRRLTALAEQAGADGRGGTGAEEEPVRHAFDEVLGTVFRGFATRTYHYYRYGTSTESTVLEQVRRLPEVLAPDAAPGFRALRDGNQGWVTLCGAGLTALALRAASPLTTDEHRAALLEFLGAALAVEVDGDAPLIDPRGRLRAVELRIPGSASMELAGTARHAGARRLLVLGRLRFDDQDAFWHCVEYDPAGVFGRWDGGDGGSGGNGAGGWGGCVVVESEVLGAADDPVRAPAVRRLLELVGERGPLPYRPEQGVDFADRVGITPLTGALVQLGSPAPDSYQGQADVPAAFLAPLGAKSADLRMATDTLRGLSVAQRREFTGLLLPGEPERVADLWTTGFAVEPLADGWIAALGKRRVIPPALVKGVVTEAGDASAVSLVLNPQRWPALTGRTEQKRVDGGLEPVDPDRLLTGTSLTSAVDALRWLAYRLPYSDPLRAVLPVTARMLRERLADPGLLMDVGAEHDDAYDPVSPRLREAYGLGPKRGAGEKELFELSAALVLTPAPYAREWDAVWLRPSAVLPGAQGGAGDGGGSDHPDLKLLAATAGRAPALEALRTLLSAEFMELVTADGPPGAQQDPLRVAPELVARVSERFGLAEDPAALYLMLLALPDPTDRHQAEWTGWKPARLKKARAALAATDLVVEAKRARAGRSLFLPGGWQEESAPRLPSETWKAALLPWDLPGFVVPDRPVEALFEATWRRIAEGDVPEFEEFRGRAGRGARGGRR